ncbi:MAG: aminopeptidase, partial [Chloroflexi bacterium]|nr:aminopeptidase [Chloroflexota bacterium]
MTTDDRITLPSGISPSKYRLSLSPDMQKFTFDGEVQITVEVLNTVNTIVLNAAELQIQKIAVTTRGKEVEILDSSLDEEDETLTISLESEIAPGNAEISIQFVGQLNDRLLGFYRSSYKDIKGDERYLATTQFESTDARRAFPCWDEPEHKATFDVTLVIPEHLTAVSNMPVISQIPASHGKTAVNFDTTPVMSTYLLAFIVGDISCIEQKSTSGTLMRVWTTKGKEEQGRFALETSLELLDFYNNYFGIPFPLPKLDHIAIPDFAAGAMENWGAITYREVALLVDPENSSAGTRQIVAAIISHEMAHMWFGDLVTMKWWNDLWLNESFASWMGDKAVDSIHPEWDMWTQFLTADTASAFSLDGLTNSHPIEQEVNNPAEIGQLFDAISYSKGGSVLRMLEDYIGAEDFRTGISDYLNKHSYSNAETSDLWNALGESSGKPVSRVMDSWVKQTG